MDAREKKGKVNCNKGGLGSGEVPGGSWEGSDTTVTTPSMSRQFCFTSIPILP